MSNTPNIPRHVAIIMDGNGRWAQQRGKDRIQGHIEGVESVRKAIIECRKRGIEYLTLYVFSIQNWARPQDEVKGLMELMCQCVVDEIDLLTENEVRITIVGQIEGIPENVKEHLRVMEEKTAKYDKLTVQLAFNYGSREEITMAAKAIAQKVKEGELQLNQVDTDLIEQHLYTAGVPTPDLLIRTSGELRLSNFLLWQLAYAEFYFTDALWPDFDEEEFDKALKEYAKRERRYGKV